MGLAKLAPGLHDLGQKPKSQGVPTTLTDAVKAIRWAVYGVANRVVPPLQHREVPHIFNSRFALPERILALSSSHSGTLSIHWVAGGFGTNGQSTANRI